MKYQRSAGFAIATVCLLLSQGYSGVFQNDTLNAYDGQYWNGLYSGGDSTILINGSDNALTIDSILVEFDDPAYTAQCHFGWEERRLQEHAIQKYHYGSTDTTDRQSVSLSKYNGADGNKLTIPARSTVTMFPIYFSETFSSVGMFIECFNGICHDYGAKSTIRTFSGRLIFVIDGERDTLHLNCEQIRWTTGISQQKATPSRRIASAAKVQTYSLLGQKSSLTARASSVQCVKRGKSATITTNLGNRRF